MKNLQKNIYKKLFFYWLETDLNKNMDLLERFRLKNHLKKQLGRGIKKNLKNNDEIDYKNAIDESNNLIDWISSMIISMYSEYDYIPANHKSINEEAEFISKSFIQAYKESKSKDKVDIISYLCIPQIKIDNKKLDSIKNIDNNDLAFIDKYKTMTLPDKLDQVFKVLNNQYNKKYKKKFRPGLNHYAVGLWYIIYQCVKDVKNFSKEYNINYIDDGEQRCLFNFFNLYIHKVLFTGKLLIPYDDRKVIFAASAIHPAQDDYIDREKVDEKVINDIYLKIEGKQIDCDDETAVSIFKLIDIIYEKYNPKENKVLVETLKELHYWQIQSSKQKSKNCNEDDLLNISFMKGGYAFAFYGYIALGRMDTLEFRHFYGMGAIFQIMDDLHDIEIDLDNNIETIWTKHIYNEKKADEVINGIIDVQKKFESITGPFSSLKRPVFLRRMELFAVRLDLLKFYLQNSKYFSNYIFDQFNDIIPGDLDKYIKKYKYSMNSIKSIDDFEAILMEIKRSYTKQFYNK